MLTSVKFIVIQYSLLITNIMKMTKYKKYKNFKGNLNDLISIIKESLIDLNLYDASLKYDRLIRYYIQEELLPRPFREGKEFYDYSHLVRFLTT